MNSELILGFAGNVVILATVLSKIYFDGRARKKETVSSTNLWKESFVRLENKVVQIAMSLDEMKNNEQFSIQFKNTLANKSKLNLAFSYVPEIYKDILVYWSEIIEKFGLRYYYSNYRSGDKKELEDFLQNDITMKINELNRYMNVIIKTPKAYKKAKIYFSDYINGSNIHSKTQLLIVRLVENGLTPKKLIETFDKYLEDFYSDFLEQISFWDKLEDYKFMDDFDK
jgi:hypothetical protein